MSKSMKVRLLIVFLVVAITLTPLAILYPRVTALTEIAYEDEKGSLNSDESDEYVGMGYGNAFDMFGEAVTGRKLSFLGAFTWFGKCTQLSTLNILILLYMVIIKSFGFVLSCRLVMGEAGSMGFYGCCLVAQAIRDTYVMGNFKSIDSVRRGYGYDGSIKYKPNDAARKAVKYILEEGHSAVIPPSHLAFT